MDNVSVLNALSISGGVDIVPLVFIGYQGYYKKVYTSVHFFRFLCTILSIILLLKIYDDTLLPHYK